MARIFLLVARTLFGAIFFVTGIAHLTKSEMMSGYAKSKGVPMAELGVPFSGGMMLTGAAGIATGLFPRLGGTMLAIALATINYFMHPFWKVDDEQQKQQEMTQFMKNTSLLGAALLIAVLDKGVNHAHKHDQ